MTLRDLAVAVLAFGIVQIAETALLLVFYLRGRAELDVITARYNALHEIIARTESSVNSAACAHNSHIALYHSKSLSIHKRQTRRT